MEKQNFNILSIDGGGIRGIYAAAILQLLEDRLGIDTQRQFNLITGTSTGSIIAAGLAIGIKPSEIVKLYQKHGQAIFGKPTESLWPTRFKPGFKSIYEKAALEKLLSDTFGSITLGKIETPLIIPATDAGNGGVHVFKSAYCPDFTRDKDVLLKDAVLASCSAPTFFDPSKVGNYLLADGGLWANNPTMIAVIDAQYRLGVSLDDIRVLSIGTGHSKVAYGTKARKSWGLLNGWQSKTFISFLLSLQSQSTANYCQLLLGEKVLRLDFESDVMMPLDDVSIMDDLISRADNNFTLKAHEIKKLLNAS